MPLTPNYRGSWNHLLAYDPGDLVTYLGSTWIATDNVTPGGVPGTDSHWGIFAQAGTPGTPGGQGASLRWLGDYDSSRAYLPRDCVAYSHSAFICLVTTTAGTAPLTGTDIHSAVNSHWSTLALGVPFIWKATWDGGTQYFANDIVTYLGSLYLGLKTSTGVTPGTDPFSWTQMATFPDTAYVDAGDASSVSNAEAYADAAVAAHHDALANLTDVVFASVAPGDLLIFSSGKWRNSTLTGAFVTKGTTADQDIASTFGIPSGKSIAFESTASANWRIGRDLAAYTTTHVTSNQIQIVMANSALEGVTIGTIGHTSALEIEAQSHKIWAMADLDVAGTLSIAGTDVLTSIGAAITTAEGYTDGAISAEVTRADGAYDPLGAAAAAQAAAEAASDPLGSASTAQSNAEGYADGLILTEISRANGAYDALGAAGTAQSNAEGYADGLILTEISRANGAYDPLGAASTAQSNAEGYADGLILTEISRANGAYDPLGAANTAQSNAEGYVDGLILTEISRADGAYLHNTGGTLTGDLLFSPDNAHDIGASGATRPRTVYVGTSVVTPALVQNGTTMLQRTFVAKTTASLGAGLAEVGTVDLAKGFVLLRVESDKQARIELYQTAAQQAADATRDASTPPTPGVEHGVILDLVLPNTLSFPYTWKLSPSVYGANLEASPSNSITYAITNTDVTSQAVTVTFYFVPLET